MARVHCSAVAAILALLWAVSGKETYSWDENGYILYCPCMGEDL